MNQQLKMQLEAETSRANIDFVTAWVGDNQKRIAELVDLALDIDSQVSAKALWALEKVATIHHNILLPYIPSIVDALTMFPTSGMRRISCKILMLSDVPSDFDGPIVDFCFRMLESFDEPIGVKANCLSLIAERLDKYPELESELNAVVSEIIGNSGSKGFAVRARKVMLKDNSNGGNRS
ncbi:MAG: hypothetical protein J6T98_01445 [Salinivirgaceae bacterium]|nr:hypothetical protein [Salinivirgaceae bacterium]